jgi:hypothetical protein
MALGSILGCGGRGTSGENRERDEIDGNSRTAGNEGRRTVPDRRENPLLRYVPSHAVAAILLRPRALEEADIEFLAESNGINSLRSELNYGPGEIEQLAIINVSAPGRRPHLGVYVLRLAPGVSTKRMRNALVAESGEIDDGEWTYWEGENSSYYIPDDRTIISGNADNVRTLMAEDRRGPLRDWLSEADPDSELVVGALYDYAELLPTLHSARNILRLPIDRLATLEERLNLLPAGAVDRMLFEVRLMHAPGGRAVIQAADESLAGEIETLARAWHEKFAFAFSQVREQIGDDHSGELGEAMLELLQWVGQHLTIHRDGQRVEFDLRPEAESERFMRHLRTLARINRSSAAGEAVDAIFRELWRQGELAGPSNQMRQIALAMHNYHDAWGYFPPASICDENRKPLLSWRVALLPFLDEGDLYDQFHFDEPWDSPHNRKLVEGIPPHYRSADAPPGSTRFQLPTGRRAPFQTQPTPLGVEKFRLDYVADGTGKTIMVVEAGAARAVPWTKPDDVEFDEADPFEALGTIGEEGFRAALFDGRVLTIPRSISQDDLRRLIDPSDGERLQGFIPGF